MAYQISENKERIILGFTIAISISISVPLVVYHFTHIDGIIHMTIHAGGFVLASFLTVMAMISWKKSKIPRIIFSGFAFATLAIAQVVYMYLEKDEHAHLEFENEIFDILIVVVTVLFAIGVFYKR
tara:strand:- start:1201 stop:1578 length:378 start_codon:yes stop_codon:yes gene_type:complete